MSTTERHAPFRSTSGWRGRTATAFAVAALLPLLPRPGFAQAGDPPLRAVTMEEAVKLFARHGPGLDGAHARYRAAAGRARQGAAYPNPTVSFLREDLDRGATGYSESTVGVQQTVEWPGRTAARGRASAAAAAAARSTFRSDSLRLVLEVRRAYLEAAGAEARAAVLEEVVGVIRAAVEDAEVRREAGDISGYELRRLTLERTRIEQALAEARIERSAARRRVAARILPLSDTVAVATRGVPGGRPPPVGREAALRAALRRPSVAAGRHALRASEAEARAAAMSRIPELALSGGYKTQSDDFDGTVLGAALTLPIFDRKGGAVRAARGRRDAAEASLRIREREVRNEVLRALDRYRSARRRAGDLAEDLLAPSGDLLEIARIAYAEGEMELVELLDGANAWREARLTAIRLEIELWLAYHELSGAMGGAGGAIGSGEGP